MVAHPRKLPDQRVPSPTRFADALFAQSMPQTSWLCSRHHHGQRESLWLRVGPQAESHGMLPVCMELRNSTGVIAGLDACILPSFGSSDQIEIDTSCIPIDGFESLWNNAVSSFRRS